MPDRRQEVRFENGCNHPLGRTGKVIRQPFARDANIFAFLRGRTSIFQILFPRYVLGFTTPELLD